MGAITAVTTTGGGGSGQLAKLPLPTCHGFALARHPVLRCYAPAGSSSAAVDAGGGRCAVSARSRVSGCLSPHGAHALEAGRQLLSLDTVLASITGTSWPHRHVCSDVWRGGGRPGARSDLKRGEASRCWWRKTHFAVVPLAVPGKSSLANIVSCCGAVTSGGVVHSGAPGCRRTGTQSYAPEQRLATAECRCLR